MTNHEIEKYYRVEQKKINGRHDRWSTFLDAATANGVLIDATVSRV